MTSHERENQWLRGIFGNFNDETTISRLAAAGLWHQIFIHKIMPELFTHEGDIRIMRQVLKQSLSNQDILQITQEHKSQEKHGY